MSSADAAGAVTTTSPPPALDGVSESQSSDPASATASAADDGQPANAEQPMGIASSVDMGGDAEQAVERDFVGGFEAQRLDQVGVASGEGHEDAGGPGGQEGTMMLENVDESPQWYQEGDNHELKRVKVYELINSRWIDQGTAFCFGHYDETTSEALLIARAEANYNEIILQTVIRASDVYQRQQETLIVWTEPDGVDYALSFQDPEGCAEVWTFINEVQRIHASAAEQQPGSSSPGPGPDHSITTSSIIRSGHLPQPALGIIGQIDRAIKQLSRQPSIREKICEYIQQADYLKAMIDVMHQAEDLENLENLHALCSLMQTILMMNDHGMYEHILDEEIFYGVVGMLEYDPEFPIYKANYREFLQESAHFHQPIPIQDISVQRKIHHTYRLQFLKDVVLARVLDDSTFNVLNSCIIFNQIDIITHVQTDPRFLKDMVGLFEDKADPMKMNVDEASTTNGVDKGKGKPNGTSPNGTPAGDADQHRREVVLLLQQLCIMGKNVQLPARMALFKTLVDRGIVHAVQWALARPETTEEGQQMIAVAGEILTTLLDHDVNGVREHVVRQCDATDARGDLKDDSLMTLLCNMMVKSKELAVQTVVADALRMLLEMPLPEGNDSLQAPTKLFSRPKDDSKTEKFLDYFYKLCIHPLTKPIVDLPKWQDVADAPLVLTREKTNLYLSLCDLLSTFALQHSFRSHFFLFTSGLSSNLASLLSSKDKHLRLAALRYFRIHLRNANRNFLIHLTKLEVFKPIIQLTIQESQRDTLVNSSCQEFFEYMRKENLKEPMNHIMTTYEPEIRQLAQTKYTGPTMSAFITRWEINITPAPAEEEKPVIQQPLEVRRLEAEEESYFNTDDDDDDDLGPLPPVSTPPPPLASRFQYAQKRKRRVPVPVPRAPPSIHLPRTPPIGSLVDYGEEEEDLGTVALESIAAPNTNTNNNTSSAPTAAPTGTGTGTGPMPTTPRPPHRQIGGAKRARSEDADADENESGVDLGLGGGGGEGPPARPEKRRREDDEDEMLERLVTSKVKRPALAREGSGLIRVAKMVGGAEGGGGGGGGAQQQQGPKKIKLKFGAAGMAVAAAPAPTKSEAGAKDGDTG
ncbi:DUF625-domain-containing protein [Dentipellis sp. KUC8613]|nr:DUF625-domain-containing protein [Dentipellis sp. KUC8613]